jgi:exosortase/archaeosortase family protein
MEFLTRHDIFTIYCHLSQNICPIMKYLPRSLFKPLSKPVVFVVRLALIYGGYLLLQNIPAVARTLWTPVYSALGAMHARGAVALFSGLGYRVTMDRSAENVRYPPTHVVRLEKSGGVRLNYPCLAVDVTFAFFALVAAYPAPLKKKLLIVPLGMAGVQALNFVRVAGLVWVAHAHPRWLDFSHHYAFQFTVVALIFVIFAAWVGGLKHLPSDA